MQTQTILLIDDDEDEHIIFTDALRAAKINCNCSIANGWEQAKRILSVVIPDIIFLDYNMPGINGMECLKKLKQQNTFENVRMYLYSTGINDNQCKEALKIGANDCFKKPSSIEKLADLLRAVLIN